MIDEMQEELEGKAKELEEKAGNWKKASQKIQN